MPTRSQTAKSSEQTASSSPASSLDWSCCWLDELPAVLWSLRTTPNKSTGFTPFFLVYGAEAVIPTDIEFDSPRVTMYTEAEAKEA